MAVGVALPLRGGRVAAGTGLPSFWKRATRNSVFPKRDNFLLKAVFEAHTVRQVATPQRLQSLKARPIMAGLGNILDNPRHTLE